MSFTDFSKIQYMKSFDTDEEVPMGSFSLTASGELKYLRITLYNHGLIPTTEQIRTKIYSDPTRTSLLYQSEWAVLGNISNKSANWLGWIRTDYSRVNLNANHTYYLSCLIGSYTRNLLTRYISLAYDFPFPIYGGSSVLFLDNPLQLQSFSYKART